MPPDRVIRHGRVERDEWRVLEAHEAEGSLPGGRVVLPLATWGARRADLEAERDRIGVWLAPGDDPFVLAPDAASLPLVAVHFPRFADGRGYSLAVLLRTRLGFRGELRAFGDIGRDHLQGLRRCGFDAFRLPEGRDPEAALAGLEELTVRYQGDADTVPLFRRRAHG